MGWHEIFCIKTQEHSRTSVLRRNSSAPFEGGMKKMPGVHLGDMNIFRMGTRAEKTQTITEICTEIDIGKNLFVLLGNFEIKSWILL